MTKMKDKVVDFRRTREKRWRWWTATDAGVFTLTEDWTGNVTLRLCTGRDTLPYEDT